ncbi:unnamed protein product [Arabidopsis halleri]
MAVLLSDLNRRKKKWLVFVKVLSIWNNPPKHPNDQTTMILVDETGQRIDATVPTIAIKRNFPRELREGQWYLLSEFDVIPPSLPERNSDHFYQISCNRNTEVDPVRPKSQSEFFNCVDFFSINNASEEDKQYVVDVCGVVVSVSPVGKLLEGGSDMDSRYVTFTLKDTMKCYTQGDDEFTPSDDDDVFMEQVDSN